MSPIPFSPLYRWLAKILREEISQGVYKAGQALPTELALMSQYNVSSTTVRRALQGLVQEGLIYRKAGKGTFVRGIKIEETLVSLTSFAEEMQSRGIQPKFELLCAQALIPPPDIVQQLNLPLQQHAYLIERVQMADAEPIALAQGYWRCEIGEALAKQDLGRISLYETVEHILHIPLTEAVEAIGAVAADDDVASKLGIRRRAPVLVRRRLTYTTEMRPIEYTTTYYCGDRYEYKTRLARRSA